MHNGDLFTDVLHIRNMEQKIMNLFDWILCGHISGLQHKANIYQMAYKEKLVELDQALKDVGKLGNENYKLREQLIMYKEKEARVTQQKRESYLRNKKK